MCRVQIQLVGVPNNNTISITGKYASYETK